jgi:hypothetical protein
MTMRKFVLSCAAFFAMALSFSVSPVAAQQWVGPNGSDANACTQTAPCATFQRAINVGASQINCLGSGSYGPVTIQTSLTIDCGAGNVGEIVSSSVAGITITTTANVTIILRHLALNGLANNNSINGIDAQSFFSGTVTVDDCLIHGYLGGSGILFTPYAGRGLLQMSNSQLTSNNNGIFLRSNSQILSAALNRVEITGNANIGLVLNGNNVIAGTIRDSLIASNALDGIFSNSPQVYFTVEGSSIIANLFSGIESASPGTNLNVTASTIGANGTGIKATSGSVVSFGNNTLNGNGVDGNFTSTTALR